MQELKERRIDHQRKMSLSPALAPKILQRVSLGPDEVIAITGESFNRFKF